jgi:diguanylate cyclase (GGDEF)-like protein/PAS domain S-box-containing protein
MLKHAEANLAALIESTQDLIWSVDLDYRLITFNSALRQNILQYYGVRLAEGMRFHEALPPERAALWPGYYARVLAEGPFRIEYSRIEGGIMELAFNPIVVEGETTGISVFGKEITEQKAVEESRRFLAEVVESCEEAIITNDPSGKILTWNRGAEAIYGYSAEEAIGQPLSMIIAPELRELADRQFKELLNGAPLLETQGVALHKDGSRVHISVTTWPMRSSAGEVTAISTIVHDISVHHEAEKNRTLLASVVKSSGDLINTINLAGTITSWNSGAERMTGYTSEEILGKNVAILVPPGHEGEVRQNLETIQGGSSIDSVDSVFRRKDGSGIDVSLTLSPIRNSDGEVVGAAAIARDISLRKQIEMQLRDSLDTLKESQEIGGLGSYVLDIGTGEWTSSDVLDEVFGIGKEYEHTVAGWMALIHPDDRAMMAAYFAEEVAGKGVNFDKEYRIVRHEDQAVRWVHGLGRLEFDGRGQAVKMRGVIKDITERKQAEMQLRDSEERYRATFEQAAVGIVHASLEGRYLRCNARFAEIIGYPQEEVPGLSYQQITVPEDQELSLEMHRQLLEGAAEIPSAEKRYFRKDGSLIWVRVTFSSQRDGKGRILYVIAIVEEIQARKEAEERLEAIQETLRASEERYRATFEQAAVGIVLTSFDGMILRCNARFAAIVGYPLEEIPGLSVSQITVPEDRAASVEVIQQAASGACAKALEKRYIRKDGSLFWAKTTVSMQRDGQGRPLHIIAFIEDINERKQAEMLLRESEERYRTAFQTSIDAININRLEDGRFIDCNQAFLDMEGYVRDEVIGKTSLELKVWADARDRRAMVEMLRRDSRCHGLEVQFRKKNGEVFWGELSASLMEIDGVACILSITRDLTSAKAAESTIRSLAFFDPLTGLPNRRHLMERLRQPLDSGGRNVRSQALLLVDLDHFKTLNDTLGHQTGDLMLQEAARRIVACTHEDDTVCRLGGDEFVVLLEARGRVAEEAAAKAKAVGEKILAAIDQPCLLGDHECLTTASIGIAVFGDGQDSTNGILQQAEIALYQAKSAGRNTLRFFSPALQAAVSARATLEEDLRQGIKAKQFVLYYQPQVERGRMTGAEALIRWEHPRRGMVMPNDFIPLAEESRLILPLGDWVLEAACAQIALWAGHKETAHLSVAVNISALQFRQPEFVEHVLATLSRTGANVDNLRLELTESMLVENFEDIIIKMNELRSHGVRFSLDDFGTGYSSLTYLKRLPLDRLKIDRSFVHDMMVDATSGAIAQTILSLGRAMGISVIAEGVETEEQRGYLAALGCHSFQGYLFSRPLPLAKFEAFLRGFAENGSPG